MTKNFYSDIVVKKRKPGLKRVGLIALILVCIVSVVALADLFSTALTTGKFTFGLFKSKEYKFDSRTLYAVTMGQSEDKFRAFTIAGGASVLGAGGYVWYENDTYKVMANIYQSRSDAEQIVKNISNTEYTIEIQEINLDGVNVDKYEMDKEDKGIVYDAICRMYQLYIDLYDMSNNIDTKNITYIQASSIVNGYKSECKIVNSSISEVKSRYNFEALSNIHSTYVHIIEILDSLVYKLLEDNQTTSVVKYSEIEVVHKMYTLLKSL